jgi:hypothetical protein
MKYLKTFENIHTDIPDISSHLERIKAIFQDYIDEYDMEEFPDNLDGIIDEESGFFYQIFYVKTDYDKRTLLFRVKIVVNIDYPSTTFSFRKSLENKAKEFYDKQEIIEDQLKSFDYECVVNCESYEEAYLEQTFDITYQF